MHLIFDADGFSQPHPCPLGAFRVGAAFGALPLPLQRRSHQQRRSVEPRKIRFLKRSKYLLTY